MKIEEMIFTFNGMDSTDALKQYASDKIGKHANYLDKALSGKVVMTDNTHNRGVKNDFSLRIKIEVPNSFIIIDERGENMYALIDIASDILGRRFKRYFDKRSQWEGVEPWQMELEEANLSTDIEDYEEPDNYSTYVPKVSERKKLEDLRPMEEAEAIEQMELMGVRQYLFKSKKTGEFAMVYKRELGGYGIVEPKGL